MSSNKKIKKILIIGGGKMGFAIAEGVIGKKVYKKNNIVILEQSSQRRCWLKKIGYSVIDTFQENLKDSFEAIILAVKPVDIKNVLESIKPKLSEKTLVISIAAGIRISLILSYLSKNQPVVRVMPNLPVEIGEGVIAITFSKQVTKSLKNKSICIFSALGKVIEFPENKFDMVTALSGSGPAYICLFIESMISSACKSGMSSKIARELVLNTFKGTTSLLLSSGLMPEELRKNVTSPKGTTEAALKTFYKQDFQGIINQAVLAAEKRAKELSSG